MEFDFNPSFEVSWDTPKEATKQEQAPPPSPPVQSVAQSQPKTIIETFDVDNAFVDFKPNFETSVQKMEVKVPDEVPPIESLEGTVAAQIFGAYCENKFGFKLVLNKA